MRGRGGGCRSGKHQPQLPATGITARYPSRRWQSPAQLPEVEEPLSYYPVRTAPLPTRAGSPAGLHTPLEWEPRQLETLGGLQGYTLFPTGAAARLDQALSGLVLKTSMDGACTSSQGNLCGCFAFPGIKGTGVLPCM